jgi:hypothetical protein
MPQVIRNPKDGIDEVLEQVRAIDKMVSGHPSTAASHDAHAALQRATTELSLARAAVTRMAASRTVVA